MSESSQTLSLPNDPSNLHLLAIQQHYHSHRSSSEGTTLLSPCQALLRFQNSLSSTMEEGAESADKRSRSHSTSPYATLGSSGLPDDVPLSISQSYHPRSGTSSPSSSSVSSIESCSDLIAALEALTAELQENKRQLDSQELAEEHEQEGEEEENDKIDKSTSEKDTKSSTLTRDCPKPWAEEEDKVFVGRQSPVKSLASDSAKVRKEDLAEKEKILKECKNQIKTLTAANKSLERKLVETEDERNHAMAFKVPCKSNLKCWPRARGCVQDLDKMPLNDHYVEPSEIISVLLESERRYVTGLTLLDSHYQQPMRMLSSFKPEILSMQQLNTIFLNCTELVILHRIFYEDLLQIRSLPESAQVDKLFEVMECTFPAFSHYNSYLAGNRQQNIEKELRQLKNRPQFEQLMDHCQQNTEGVSLTALLNMPTERMSEYSEVLTHFMNPRVRALPEDASKRAEALIRYLRNIRYDFSEQKSSEWDHTLDKIKLLNKLATEGAIPLEIFNSEVRLMKQGPLTQVVGKKETAKHCILFNNFIALAQAKDNQYRIAENGMISLYGAQLFKCVDVEGQAIGCDLQSGLNEDKLAFGLSLVNNESLYLRAAKPNVWKQWVEVLEKSIQETQKLHMELEMDTSNHRPVDIPKIAAASLEKLFQQLTSPHFEHQDFIRIFLLTHSCFTTPQEVLTALLNCIKSPEDDYDRTSQVSENDLFLFNVPMEEMSGSGSDCVSASPSMYTINTDSEIGSPGPSPSVVRRGASSTHTSIMSTSPSPNSLLRTGNSARKAVYSAASFASTDSDISPHTSAIVVDNTTISTKDGWAESGEPEIGTRTGKMNLEHLSPSTSPSNSSCYSKLYPRHREFIESEASDQETEISAAIRNASVTSAGSDRTVRQVNRSFSESSDIYARSPLGDEDETLKTLNGIGHSERMMTALDESSKMLAQLTESLSTDGGRRNTKEMEVFVQDSVVKRRSRTLSSNALNRLGIVSSFSNSEPDLSGCGIDEGDTPPPLPPRHPSMIPSLKTTDEDDMVTQSLHGFRSSSRIGSRGSERSLLSCSLSIGHGDTLEGHGKDKKSKTLEKMKGKKKTKKSDTFSSRSTPTGSVLSSPARSATLYFGSSPSHSANLALSASFTSADTSKTPKKSRWLNLRSKVGKKLSRSPSHTSDLDKVSGKPQRSQSIPSSRKGSIYPGSRNGSVSGEDMGLTDGGSVGMVSPRLRKASTGNSVNLVSKIFSVLSLWVEEFFEDFEVNSELTQSLSEFLESLTNKTTNGALEYHRAIQLLDGLKRKIQFTSTPAPNCPFPILLSRVIRLTPEVLSMYDWENPDKLMQGVEIDLSKSLPKDSPCLKMIAEQLTLMEFSVYSVIQRKELLNCNWKKPDKGNLSPNVCRLIKRTNDMTSWVSTEILQRKTPSQRAVVIEHFIQIANYCYKHNDLHCALNITIALGSACIKSLRLTWNEVDKKYRHRFEKLRDAMDYHGKCKKMRENLEQLTQDTVSKTGELPAALPYIGAYLDIIYTLEIQSKTFNHNGLVNFAKMTKLAELVTLVLQYQDVGFNFVPKPEMMAYVTASKRLSENELFDRSMTVEPPSN